MRIAVIGDGEAERAWADWVRESPDHVLIATGDVDEVLSATGFDAVVVGGPIPDRAEALRRASVEGLAVVCLHPPGADALAYYHAAANVETAGGVVVPDLPMRLHPGLAPLRSAIVDGSLGEFRSLRQVVPAVVGEDLVRVSFAQSIDVLRSLLGEFQTLTASGDPEGTEPAHDLVVRLRAEGGRLAELRIAPGEFASLGVMGSEGACDLDFDASWDPHAAILESLQVPGGRGSTLLDGIRAMELTEAVERSLRRGRTIDLHREPMGEEARFKSLMTTAGCLVLLGAVMLFVAASAGRALGFEGAVYLAYLIPPGLVAFLALQFLRPRAATPDEPPALEGPTD
ncbi:hypothetical protein [Planctomyces sp. SH-PL62]|uniref:hypothetical protein n=1 Tax=Planctomyces sp. SH-PL62 TaxID=1636152 RepID=UPI0012E927D4|nr:hypothetical protein [Planctomyces sp. SH-PL62]